MNLQKPIAFVDVETTGTDPSKHEVIEIGVIIARLKDGVFEVVDELDLKIQPKHIENAEPQALRINGYNEADWLFAVSLEEAMKNFIKKTDGAIFTSHNVVFDYSFVQAALKSCGLEDTMHFHKLDTISMAFGVHHDSDDLNKYSLRSLCEHYGIENKRAHSAYADTYALYEVFKKLLNLK